MDDAPGERPVSYHGSGTNEEGKNIAQYGSEQTKGKGDVYERGIFMSPDIAVAAKFASTFEHAGRSYRMVLQNRVNPEGLKMVGGGAGEQYWIQSKPEFVRPYGICIQSV